MSLLTCVAAVRVLRRVSLPPSRVSTRYLGELPPWNLSNPDHHVFEANALSSSLHDKQQHVLRCPFVVPAMAMEVTLELPIQVPTPTDRRPSALDLPRRQHQSPVEPSPRSAFPPRPAGRDAKARKSPPLVGPRDADRSSARRAAPGKLKANLVPGSAPLRSLLPVTERKSQEENKFEMRPRKVSDGDRNNIAPDGMSAGREGRQFTVSNVGNNGRIFLRYVIW